MAQNQMSPDKLRDTKRRKAYLLSMEKAIKENLPMTAKYAGMETKRLGERIKTHDYTQDDALRAKFPHTDFDRPLSTVLEVSRAKVQ